MNKLLLFTLTSALVTGHKTEAMLAQAARRIITTKSARQLFSTISLSDYQTVIEQIKRHEKKLIDEEKFVSYYQISKDNDFACQLFAKLSKIMDKEKVHKSNEPQYFMTLLSSNKYLLSELDNPGNCTIDYVDRNFSINNLCIPIKDIFDWFEISDATYNKYKNRIEELKKLNSQMNVKSIAQIEFTREQFSRTQSYNGNATGLEVEIQGLEKIESDKNGTLTLEIVQKIPMAVEVNISFGETTTHYNALAPKYSIIKMHIYHTGNENEWQSYIKQRNELFKEIANNIEKKYIDVDGKEKIA